MDLVVALLPLVLLASLLVGLLRLSRRTPTRRRGAQYDLGPGRAREQGDRVFARGASFGSGS